MQGITNAITSSEDYYTKGETDTLLAGKANVATTLAGYGITDGANTSLDNLSANGQMIIDSANGTISNCILEIPQNIKLELSNNVLTLKSGSIITRTGNTYTTITLTQDNVWNNIVIDGRPDGKYVMFSQANNHIPQPRPIDRIFSGNSSSFPQNPQDYDLYFNTDEKLIYRYNTATSTWSQYVSAYPFCVIEIKNRILSFAKDSNGNDMIFNGAGFIGHHAFVYPGVRKLICNGKADGKLNSYNELVNGLYIVDLGQGVGIRAVISRNGNTYYSNLYWEVDKYSDLVTRAGIQYCRETNYCYVYNNGIFNEQSRLSLIYITYNGTTITDFTIRQPYQGARNLLTDDLYKQIGDVETLLATI